MRKETYKKSKLVLMIYVLIVLAAISPDYMFAQETIKVIDQGWKADFRDHITFTLTAESTSEIVKVNLFYQVVGQIASSRNDAEFTPGTTVNAEFVIDQTDPSNYSPPGTELQYWWKIVDAGGNEIKTDKETLIYLDDRYDWRNLENERLTLYWYEGDDDFGQSLFERANTALNTLETDMGITLENPIKIFIYGSHQDLLSALRTSAQEWTGGVAFTEFGVVLIGIHPNQLDWGLNAMTHEMTHLVIHQATDNPFGDLPRWLDEGIAVYNENPNELDQDFRSIFERAVKSNELMTLRTLSSPFPGDPLEANLAYGQSGAVVKFIIDTYGPEAMANLLSIFAEGALYDEALEQALHVDTDGLDNEFRTSLGLPLLPGTETRTTQDEPAPSELTIAEPDPNAESVVEVEEESTEAEVGVVEPVPNEAAATEAVSVEGATANASDRETVSERDPTGLLSCLAGLLPFVAIGAAVLRPKSWWSSEQKAL